MNVFEKIIEKLEKYKDESLIEHDSEESLHCQENEDDWCSCRNCFVCVWQKAMRIIEEVAEEHNNGWKTVVNEEIKNPFVNISTVGCVNCEHKDEYIIELEEDNNGWIPCSERLPETEEYILISFENFSVPIVGRYEEDEEGGAFYAGDETETCASQEMFVNAWQPLPEPYKAEMK